MVTAYFLAPPDGKLLGFHILGHAACGEAGQDIVCAAVSSAAYLVANTVTDILSVTPFSMEVGEGEMHFEISPRDERICRVLLAGLKLHLLGLEEQYPQAVRVTTIEV